MTEQEAKKKIKKLQSAGVNIVIVDCDEEGNILSCGTERDFDTHSSDVANGNGFYDQHGNYIDFGLYDAEKNNP